MAPRTKRDEDPVPQVIAGVMTVKCECGWEMPFIMPEESLAVMNFVFEHLQKKHDVKFPTICCFWH